MWYQKLFSYNSMSFWASCRRGSFVFTTIEETIWNIPTKKKTTHPSARFKQFTKCTCLTFHSFQKHIIIKCMKLSPSLYLCTFLSLFLIISVFHPMFHAAGWFAVSQIPNYQQAHFWMCSFPSERQWQKNQPSLKLLFNFVWTNNKEISTRCACRNSFFCVFFFSNVTLSVENIKINWVQIKRLKKKNQNTNGQKSLLFHSDSIATKKMMIFSKLFGK